MIHVISHAIPCDEAQLVSSLQVATTVFQRTLNSNDSEDVCYAMYANICQPYFSAACQESSSKQGSSLEDIVRPSALETWGLGLLFVCVVCSCAAFGLCLYPIMKKKIFKHVLTWMMGLAIGSLSGIAVFQLLPQAFELSDETPEQVDNYIHKSLVIILSIYVFFLSERIFKVIMEHRGRGQGHPKKVSQATRQSLVENGTAATLILDSQGVAKFSEMQDASVYGSSEKTSDGVEEKHEARLMVKHGHFHELGTDSTQPIQTVAWLILSGDSIVDGLSIGAAFSFSSLRGVSIAIAVLCEELPHELGDLAILLHSGLSLKRAILYNSISGLTCFVGFAVGVFLGELTAASTWIFAVASGMFIYISFVNILPEMTAAVEDASRSSTKQAVLVLSIQTFGLIVGIVLMYVLARFSGQIQIG